MIVLIYILALVVGLSMGLLGGGGSILAVPIFVYLMDVPELTATSYSLFVVGLVAVVGSYRYYSKSLIDIKTAVLFGVPTAISGFITKKYLVSNLPDIMYQGESFQVSKEMFVMILFGLVMLLASFAMIKGQRGFKLFPENVKMPIWVVLIIGSIIGALTSLIGAGGGFLIVPTLVIFMQIPIHIAIGTSLLIIAVNSLSSFIGAMDSYGEFDWKFLLIFSTLAMLGVLIGTKMGQKVAPSKLKRAFGWFVLSMAILIMVKTFVG